MKTLLAILFGVLTLVHLYSCFFHAERVRRATKPLLMPLLAAVYLCFADGPVWLVPAALLCGMVGDILLLYQYKRTCFITGAAMFAIGHVIYIYVLLTRTGAGTMPVWAFAAAFVPYIALVILMYGRAKAFLEGSNRLLMPLYMLLLSSVSVCAVMSLAAEHGTGNVLLVAGTWCFLASDYKLMFEVFGGATKRGNFFVMLTYIAAQALITAGFIVRGLA